MIYVIYEAVFTLTHNRRIYRTFTL